MEPEKIREILINLGYHLNDKGQYWQTNAIFRNGDNKTAIQIYKNTGVWRDFVEGGNFLPFDALVKKTLNTNSEDEIKKYLNDDNYQSFTRNLQQFESSPIFTETTYPISCLSKLKKDYSFYNSRGIGSDTLSFFKCGVVESGEMFNRIVFPIFNKHGKIHGFSGRALQWDKEAKYPKWKHHGKVSNFLYPIYMENKSGEMPAKQSIIDSGEIILVESIGDGLALFEHGIKNFAICFSVNVSPKIITEIISLGCSKIVFAFNNDTTSPENRGLLGAIKNYSRFLEYFDIDSLKICLPDNGDFGEMNSEGFSKWKQKKENVDSSKQIFRIRDYAAKFLQKRLINQEHFNLIKNAAKEKEFQF